MQTRYSVISLRQSANSRTSVEVLLVPSDETTELVEIDDRDSSLSRRRFLKRRAAAGLGAAVLYVAPSMSTSRADSAYGHPHSHTQPNVDSAYGHSNPLIYSRQVNTSKTLKYSVNS